MGYTPTVFKQSPQALEHLKENPSKYRLIITDLSMPGMTGIELIAEVNRLGIDVPVVLCSGFSEEVSEQTAALYGIAVFLLKPVSKADLVEALLEVFDGQPG